VIASEWFSNRKGSKEDRGRQGQRGTKEIGTQEILEMKKSIWKKGVREDASAKGLGPRNRVEGGVYTEKGKGVSV